MMKLVNWVQFSWDLSKNPPSCPALSPSFSIRRATADDEAAVRSIVLSSFTLDSDWNSFFGEIRPLLEEALAEVFHEKDDPFCLVLVHGPRVIGASGLNAERDARQNLVTGPCLALEYHNRGFGTALLAHSLQALREAGLTTVRGETKRGSATEQFLYPKFGAVRLDDKRK